MHGRLPLVLAALCMLTLPWVPAGSAHHTIHAGQDAITVLDGPDQVTWRSVAFSPDGSHALLAGLWSEDNATRDVLGRWTPEDGLEIVYNRSGAGLIDVAFHPSGTSAVVGLQSTILLGEPGAYENVWNRSEFHDQGLEFFGLRVAFAPHADRAVVTGSSLLELDMDGELSVIHGGRGAFFRAAAWNPTGSVQTDYALVEAALERDGGALLGTIWRTDGTPPLEEGDNVAVYGLSNRGKALVNTIAFAPNGTFATMAGRDGGGASVLTWSASRGEEAWQYLPAGKDHGPLTCITWDHDGQAALAVGLDRDQIGYVDDRLYVPAVHRAPGDLFGCDTHPEQALSLAVGEHGTVLVIEPGEAPLPRVVRPSPGALVPPQENATFLVGLLQRSPASVAIQGQVAGSSASVTVEEQGPWYVARADTSELKDGVHTLVLEATAGQASTTVRHDFLVNNEAFAPEAPEMRAPEGLEGQGTDVDGQFTLRWTTVDGPVVYEVQENASNATVDTTRRLQAGPGDNLTMRLSEDGTYQYRVRATNAFNHSAWSPWVTVHVILDSDNDGVPDDRDPQPYIANTWGDSDEDGIRDDVEYRQCSDPFDANSTPGSDDDGDGIANGKECLQGTDPSDPSDPPPDGGVGTDGGAGNESEEPNGSPGPGAWLALILGTLTAAVTARRST